MILVTGGFGFIGSNIIRNLNKRGFNNIIVVDDLTNGHKFRNLVDCKFETFIDKDDTFTTSKIDWSKLTYIFHEGAISSTTEWNGKLVMKDNLEYSEKLLAKAMEYEIKFSYASSASVYGDTGNFKEDGPKNPLNLYAYSKLLFDNKVEDIINKDWYNKSPYVIQGYRYFNVYGSGEDHKNSQASPIHQFSKQAIQNKEIKVFKGSENFIRDFVCIDDIVILKIEMLDRNISGIFNVGTNRPISFMDVAKLISNKTGAKITEIPFPDNLKGHYQTYTCADMDKIRQVGCPVRFRSVEEYLT